jgi:hypothetical protein
MALYEVRQGALHGQGTFALVDLDEEFVLGEVRGQLFDDPLYDSYTCASVDDKRHITIEPDDTGVPVHRMNHSCDANCYLRTDGADSLRLLCVTQCPVQAGDELTIDYQWPAFVKGKLAPRCRCGAESCRQWLADEEELAFIECHLSPPPVDKWYRRTPSRIHGTGLIARRRISKKTVIGAVGDAGVPEPLLNHACKPNVELVEYVGGGPTFAQALRTIRAGEELTTSYDDPPSPCRCPTCRRRRQARRASV